MPLASLIGYAASVLVAVSLMMSNVKRLRWVNLAGALTFSAYGAWVAAWPVFAVNLFIVGVDAWYLVQMSRRSEFFTLLPVQGEAPLARKFLRYYEADLARFFPGASREALERATGYFVLRNLLPVGVFLYEVRAADEVEILADYVIPEYRDRKNAEFVFRILNEKLGQEGRRAFVVRSPSPAHERYLRREGFAPDPRDPSRFQKAII